MSIAPPRRWIPVALAVALGAWVESPEWALVAVLAAPALALLPTRGRLRFAGALAGLWVAASAATWASVAPPAPALPLAGEVVAITLKGDADWVDVAPDGAPAWRVRARLTGRPPALTVGARVRMMGRLERPPPADNPGGFDAQARAAAAQVRWLLRGHLVLTEAGAPAPALALRTAARARLQRCDEAFGAAVLRGVLLGDRAAVPDAALAALEATGTGHLLAVSGLHVGGLAWVVFGLTAFALRRAHRVAPDRWAAIVAVPAALGYAALAQWPISATRAAIMVGLYLLGRALDRPADGLNLLGFAAAATLLTAPSAIFEPAFQLSFGAVAALLWAPGGRGLVGAARVALVAAAVTAPIQAAHFGTLAPLSPLANLVITPLASLILVPLSLLGLAVAPWWPGLLDLAAEGAAALVALSEALADLGGGVWIVGAAAAPALAAPAILALTWWRARRLGLVVAAALLATLAWPAPPAVDFVAVGQGDAVLVRDGARALLVDAGPDVQARALLGVLRRAGVARLDALLITHGHPDHFGGARAVLEALPVDRVAYNGRVAGGLEWRRLRQVAAARAIPFEAAVDARLEWPRLVLETRANRASPTAMENDASLVVRVASATAAVLLTGDLERAGEAALVADAPAPVTVLKAGHHGSRTSTSGALLDRLRPAVVVASCGRRNRFGFPHAEVRDRLAAAAVPLWRTDRDGAVRVELGDPPVLRARWRAAVRLEARP